VGKRERIRKSVREEGTYVLERKGEGVRLTPGIVFEIGFEAPGWSARGALCLAVAGYGS